MANFSRLLICQGRQPQWWFTSWEKYTCTPHIQSRTPFIHTNTHTNTNTHSLTHTHTPTTPPPPHTHTPPSPPHTTHSIKQVYTNFTEKQDVIVTRNGIILFQTITYWLFSSSSFIYMSLRGKTYSLWCGTSSFSFRPLPTHLVAFKRHWEGRLTSLWRRTSSFSSRPVLTHLLVFKRHWEGRLTSLWRGSHSPPEHYLTPSQLWCHLKTTNKSAKFQTHNCFSVFFFFFALACEIIFIETRSTQSRCYSSKKYTVCRRVRASFIPEILQAGAVKRLMICLYDIVAWKTYVTVTWSWNHHVAVAFRLVLGSHHCRQQQHRHQEAYSKTRCHWPLRPNRTLRKQSRCHGFRRRNVDTVAVSVGRRSPDVSPSVWPSDWNVQAGSVSGLQCSMFYYWLLLTFSVQANRELWYIPTVWSKAIQKLLCLLIVYFKRTQKSRSTQNLC